MNLCDNISNYFPFQRFDWCGLVLEMGAHLRGRLVDNTLCRVGAYSRGMLKQSITVLHLNHVISEGNSSEIFIFLLEYIQNFSSRPHKNIFVSHHLKILKVMRACEF